MDKIPIMSNQKLFEALEKLEQNWEGDNFYRPDGINDDPSIGWAINELSDKASEHLFGPVLIVIEAYKEYKKESRDIPIKKQD